MTKVRINKFLSDSGICSRREADEHILAGEAKINDAVAFLGNKVDPEKDEIKFKDKVVKKRERFVYYAIYKPKGYISTASDEQGRKTVLDLAPKSPRVYPVGRLDKDSEGLIILTNDGELTNLLTHPSHSINKEYRVEIRNTKSEALNKSEIQNVKKRFIDGLNIDGQLMKADKIKIFILHVTSYLIHITIHTGYNRQIRKMCAKLDLEVVKLKRIRIGKLELKNLNINSGECKIIDKKSII